VKIALCIRKEYDTRFGGDSVQLLKTRQWLQQLYSIETVIVTDPESLDETFDIIHIFNLATKEETRAFFEKATSLKKKIALSTIFWDYTYQATKDFASALNYHIFYPAGLVKIFAQLDTITSKLVNRPRIISSSFRNFVKECLLQSHALLPNSIEELHHVAVFAGINANILLAKTTVVVNATDFEETNAISGFHQRYSLPENYILQVGRMEYIKNQLVVVEALKNHRDLPIVFLGRPNGEKYVRILKEKAEKRGNVFFREEVPHSDIHHFFQHAILHILPSLRESPGLVNLEALLNECPIVVSDSRFLPFDSYFQGIATAVNPLSPTSVREGIFTELETKRDMKVIRNLVIQKFSWEQAARQTFSAYQKLFA
jgi:glycosyltransferase involved in cell wall biosynthesis